MRSARMMAVQEKRELIPKIAVFAHGFLKQALLVIPRQVRPQAQCGLAENIRKLLETLVHVSFPRLDRVRGKSRSLVKGFSSPAIFDATAKALRRKAAR